MSTSSELSPAARQPTPDGRAKRRQALGWLAKYGTIVGMLIMLISFSIASPSYFPTVGNFINILNQAALTAIIAGGLTVAVIVGELDLSIGFHASLAGVLVTGLMVNQHLPMALAILAVLAFSTVVGIVNGLIVTKLRVNSVIATLGTGSIILGLNYAYSTGAPVATGLPDAFFNLTLGSLFGIPNNVIFMLVALTVLWVLMNRSEFGQRVQAVGGNLEAARLSGIRVDRIKVYAFVVAAVTASITGILLASLIGSGTTGAADAYLLNSFAAVFLGSATLTDGEFHIPGTFIGVLIIGIAFNGLAIFGAPTFYQYVFQGLILVAAVGLSTVTRRYAES